MPARSARRASRQRGSGRWKDPPAARRDRPAAAPAAPARARATERRATWRERYASESPAYDHCAQAEFRLDALGNRARFVVRAVGPEVQAVERAARDHLERLREPGQLALHAGTQTLRRLARGESAQLQEDAPLERRLRLQRGCLAGL